MEHQLDTKEYCLFVHKRLRPIRTRPEGEGAPQRSRGRRRGWALGCTPGSCSADWRAPAARQRACREAHAACAALHDASALPPSAPPPPADKNRPAPEKPGLLRELITNSFTFQHDPELRAQLAASMAAATSAGGSGASSITFQQAAAAATGVEVM